MAWLVALGVGCSSPSIVSVIRSPSHAPRPGSRLEIRVDATSAHLPLNVVGASVAFADVDRALERSVEQALAPLEDELEAHHASRRELFVELTSAHVEYIRGQLVSELTVRATLRQMSGNAYLAQTHAHSNASSTTAPESGAFVLIQCTDAIASQLSGWLSGMNLN